MLRWHVDFLCGEFDPGEIFEEICVVGGVQMDVCEGRVAGLWEMSADFKGGKAGGKPPFCALISYVVHCISLRKLRRMQKCFGVVPNIRDRSCYVRLSVSLKAHGSAFDIEIVRQAEKDIFKPGHRLPALRDKSKRYD